MLTAKEVCNDPELLHQAWLAIPKSKRLDPMFWYDQPYREDDQLRMLGDWLNMMQAFCNYIDWNLNED